MVKNPQASGFLTSVLSSGSGEGVEELSEGLLDYVWEKLTFNPESKFTWETFTDITIEPSARSATASSEATAHPVNTIEGSTGRSTDQVLNVPKTDPQPTSEAPHGANTPVHNNISQFSQNIKSYSASANPALAGKVKQQAKRTALMKAFMAAGGKPQGSDAKSITNIGKLAKALGVTVELAPPTGKNSANGWIDGNKVYIAADAENPLHVVAMHELTHRLQTLAPEAYLDFRDYVMLQLGGERTGAVSDAVQAKQAAYARAGVTLSTEQAMDELAADYAGRLVADEAAIKRFVTQKRTTAQKFFDILKSLIEQLKSAFRGNKAEYDETTAKLGRALTLWGEAFGEASEKVRGEKNTVAAVNGELQYFLNPSFAEKIDTWDGKTDTTFRIGTTSEALRNIGVQDREIIWHSGKINKILKKHAGMTRIIIKQVPEILENPIAVLKSQSSGNRITMFGEVMDENGAPVMAILELQPTNGGGATSRPKCYRKCLR